jgi:hypothetical protein
LPGAPAALEIAVSDSNAVTARAALIISWVGWFCTVECYCGGGTMQLARGQCQGE